MGKKKRKGRGSAGSKDGEKEKASFSSPSGITIDQQTGTIYVSDKGSHIIRKITPQGTFSSSFSLPADFNVILGAVTTLAGSSGRRGSVDGVATKARFEYPKGIWYSDKEKVLFVCDYGNDKLRTVNVSDGK